MDKCYLCFAVRGQSITRTDDLEPVGGTRNYLFARFELSEEWRGLHQTAVFSSNGCKPIGVEIRSGQCEVPWEVLRGPEFRVGVFAGDLLTTDMVRVPVRTPVKTTAVPGVQPTPGAYETLVSRTEEALRKMPRIQNGSWWLWDPQLETYTDSGISAGGGQAAPEDTPTPAEYFCIDHDGILWLKPQYRGCADEEGKAHSPYSISDMGVGKEGSRLQELPEKIVIPDVINGTAVAGLAPGMFFMNYRVKEIVLPDGVDALPDLFCREALNLHTLRNTERIRKMGKTVAAYTRVEKLLFPNLQEVVSQSLAACGYLRVVDIGNHATEIPSQMFYQSVKLSRVMGGGSVTKIGSKAFYLTMDLKNLPLLSNVTNIGDDAFYRSRIQFDWSSLAGKCTFGTRATPVIDNTVDFWSGVNYTPCENRIVSMLSQKDPRWENEYFGSSATLNKDGCAIFCILHIHSAITGNMYATVKEFEDELQQTAPALLLEENHPKHDSKRIAFIEALGYKAEMHTGTLDTAAYQSICDALARGAYVYISIGAGTNVNDGHGVVLYGMNDIGEVMVLDSNYMMHTMHGSAVEREFMTYCLPLQNVTGTTNEFVVVEKKEE